MFFIASKILHFLLKPILWIFFGCLFGVWKKRGNKPFWAGLFLFAYLISNQFLVDLVLRAYEPDAYPIREIPENINGIILLGGYSSYMEDAERSVFLSSADRFLQMLQVHRSKNISPVIITGGSGNLYKPEDTEAKFVAQYLKNTQLDTGQFWYEADSRNTYQNAVKSKELIENASMSKENWLLISSAFHIPRSL
ncbi:MAG: YdcF family protein, partial [Luteibaculum sp.]